MRNLLLFLVFIYSWLRLFIVEETKEEKETVKEKKKLILEQEFAVLADESSLVPDAAIVFLSEDRMAISLSKDPTHANSKWSLVGRDSYEV
jgi:hypothetical protein